MDGLESRLLAENEFQAQQRKYLTQIKITAIFHLVIGILLIATGSVAIAYLALWCYIAVPIWSGALIYALTGAIGLCTASSQNHSLAAGYITTSVISLMTSAALVTCFTIAAVEERESICQPGSKASIINVCYKSKVARVSLDAVIASLALGDIIPAIMSICACSWLTRICCSKPSSVHPVDGDIIARSVPRLDDTPEIPTKVTVPYKTVHAFQESTAPSTPIASSPINDGRLEEEHRGPDVTPEVSHLHTLPIQLSPQAYSGPTLDLSDREMGPDQAQNVARLLREDSRAKLIEHFILRSNPLGDRGITAILHSLRILHFQIPVATDPDEARPRTGISLLRLDLSDTKMKNKGAIELSDFLKLPTNMTELDIGGHTIGRVGCKALATGLRTNDALKTLSFSNSDLGDVRVREILEAAHEHPALVEINVEGNDITDEGALAILELVKENDVIRTVHFEKDNDISPEVVEEIENILKTRLNIPDP